MEALTPETALVLRVRLEKVAREGRWEEAAATGARALQLLDGAPRWQPNVDCCDELARIGLAPACKRCGAGDGRGAGAALGDGPSASRRRIAA